MSPAAGDKTEQRIYKVSRNILTRPLYHILRRMGSGRVRRRETRYPGDEKKENGMSGRTAALRRPEDIELRDMKSGKAARRAGMGICGRNAFGGPIIRKTAAGFRKTAPPRYFIRMRRPERHPSFISFAVWIFGKHHPPPPSGAAALLPPETERHPCSLAMRLLKDRCREDPVSLPLWGRWHRALSAMTEEVLRYARSFPAQPF